MTNPILSDLVQELVINNVTFYVRGLSTSEILHLNIRVGPKGAIGQVEFVTIGKDCLVGWSGLRFERRGVLHELKFSPSNIDTLPAAVLYQIGEFAYTQLSMLSETEAQQLKGYIRFSSYLSDEKNKAQEKTYDCDACIKGGYYMNRLCGLPNKQALIDKYHPPTPTTLVVPEAPERKKKSRANIMSSYTVKRSRAAPMDLPGVPQAPEPEPEPEIKEAPVFKIPKVNFSYPECPVSWIPSPVKMLANFMYSSGKANMPFYNGGVGDQPYKIYTAQQIVLSESSKIEIERMDEERRQSSSGSKKRGK